MPSDSSSPVAGNSPEITLFPGRKPLPQGAFRQPLHLAIGMFDGVHRGHEAVIRQAMGAVDVPSGECAGVLTFDPHPSRVLYPERATPLLMPLGQRIDRMFRLGVDNVFVQSFTREYARREAATFVASLCSFFPGLKSLHIGENFRFGANRSGDVNTLRQSGREAGIEVHALKREIFSGKPISSSRIRHALSEGRIGEVNDMLGYPYTIQGVIEPGQQVGRGLGFPTLNIPWAREAAPCFGVYRTVLKKGPDGRVQPGIANYGLRPTVGGTEQPLLEVHLLEPQEIPETGASVQVALLEFLRPEKAFSSVKELGAQIRLDVEEALRRFARGNGKLLEKL